ncbi:CDGSH iron-sulfur domain-containing protein [bacterium]|nr:CDGSH iron-sulfur domain-containing protein [bacterium]
MSENKVEIKFAKNGPILVKGNCEMVDSEGKAIAAKESFALCRCGGSKNKPFCDGTHKTNGFQG